MSKGGGSEIGRRGCERRGKSVGERKGKIEREGLRDREIQRKRDRVRCAGIVL